MTLFKSFEEYLETVILMIRDMSDDSLKKITLAINVCDSYMDENEKMFRLNTSLKECFWEIEEAILCGFHKYLKEQSAKTKELVEYHKVNCQGEDCVVCDARNKTINRMRNLNERKRPKLCP